MTSNQVTSAPAKGSRGLGGARGFDREKDDFYPTPRALLDPLILRDHEHIKTGVWEPACGDGAICKALEEHDIPALGTDLVDRGFGTSRVDFLMEMRAPGAFEAIITNPPFRLWREFAERASGMGVPYFALLGRLQLLEGKRMSAMFAKTCLSRVMVSAGRVNMLPPGAEDKGHNGMIAWAWFVWLPGHDGPPTIEWFTPAKAKP